MSTPAVLAPAPTRTHDLPPKRELRVPPRWAAALGATAFLVLGFSAPMLSTSWVSSSGLVWIGVATVVGAVTLAGVRPLPAGVLAVTGFGLQVVGGQFSFASYVGVAVVLVVVTWASPRLGALMVGATAAVLALVFVVGATVIVAFGSGTQLGLAGTGDDAKKLMGFVLPLLVAYGIGWGLRRRPVQTQPIPTPNVSGVETGVVLAVLAAVLLRAMSDFVEQTAANILASSLLFVVAGFIVAWALWRPRAAMVVFGVISLTMVLLTPYVLAPGSRLSLLLLAVPLGYLAGRRSRVDAALVTVICLMVPIAMVGLSVLERVPFFAFPRTPYLPFVFGSSWSVTVSLYWLALWSAPGLAAVFGVLVKERQDVDQQRREVAEQQEALDVRSAIQGERTRLARELHDVVAHHVSLIAVRAETGPFTVPDLSPDGRRLLSDIAAEARDAMTELRAILGVLRQPDEDTLERRPQPTMADLDRLVVEARMTGSHVTYDRDPGEVPDAVAVTVYRVVQEALTNARRHAPGAAIAVTIRREPRMLVVDVLNAPPVPMPVPGDVTGFGLVGMEERVRALGGALAFGPTVDGGFRVSVRVPISAP